MSKENARPKLDQLLKQLYVKKEWLETMIRGLESATTSADFRLIESVRRILGQSPQRKPTVTLDHQQIRLARLANQVRRGAVARAGRYSQNGAQNPGALEAMGREPTPSEKRVYGGNLL